MLRRLEVAVDVEADACGEQAAESREEGACRGSAIAVSSHAACSSSSEIIRSNGANAIDVACLGEDLSASETATEDTATEEVTTTCIRALLRESRSSRPSLASRASFVSSARPSLASSAFEDPTYTMQEVQREVLGLFSSSSPTQVAEVMQAASTEAVEHDDGQASQHLLRMSSDEFSADSVPSMTAAFPLGASSSTNDELAPRSLAFDVFQEELAAPRSSAFDVFQEPDLAEQELCGSLATGASPLGGVGGVAVPELRRRSGGIPIWDDSEFDAAMR